MRLPGKTESGTLKQIALENKIMRPKTKRKLASPLALTRRKFSAGETFAMKGNMNITY